jgi:hypothetical protein
MSHRNLLPLSSGYKRVKLGFRWALWSDKKKTKKKQTDLSEADNKKCVITEILGGF